VAYKIDTDKCLKCGVCITDCPEGAIVSDETVTEPDGLVLYTARIDQDKCTECGVCLSQEWWCPAQAIIQV